MIRKCGTELQMENAELKRSGKRKVWNSVIVWR